MDANKSDYEIEPSYRIREILECLETIEIDNLIIGGGEPFLRDDIFKILKKSVDMVSTSVLTNGTLMNPGVAKKLRQTGIQSISISLDSTVPEIHDEFRDGSFSLASEALRLCVKEGIDVDMGVCLTKKNFKDSLKLIEMADNLDLKSITFEGLNLVGRAKECEALGLTPQETDHFLNTISHYLKDETPDIDVIVFYPQWVRWNSNAVGCEAGKNLFGLLPSGDILACTNLPVSFGNILENDFKDIWNSEMMDEIRNTRIGGCNLCEYKEKCGGCRSRAYGAGDMFGSDPSCTLAFKTE